MKLNPQDLETIASLTLDHYNQNAEEFWQGVAVRVQHTEQILHGGVCEPECPVEAIKPDTEAGAEKWLNLNADYAKTWPNITVKRAPPADSKEWEGKPDKLQYFSPNPGAGD